MNMRAIECRAWDREENRFWSHAERTYDNSSNPGCRDECDFGEVIDDQRRYSIEFYTTVRTRGGKIFEQDYLSDGRRLWIVSWSREELTWVLSWPGRSGNVRLADINPRVWRVIGNRHEHSDLEIKYPEGILPDVGKN